MKRWKSKKVKRNRISCGRINGKIWKIQNWENARYNFPIDVKENAAKEHGEIRWRMWWKWGKRKVLLECPECIYVRISRDAKRNAQESSASTLRYIYAHLHTLPHRLDRALNRIIISFNLCALLVVIILNVARPGKHFACDVARAFSRAPYFSLRNLFILIAPLFHARHLLSHLGLLYPSTCFDTAEYAAAEQSTSVASVTCFH